MNRRICSIEQLKKESLRGGSFYILLKNRMKCNRWVRWDPVRKMFYVRGEMDDFEDEVPEYQIYNRSWTTIGCAIRRGTFYKYGWQKNEAGDAA